MDKGISGAHVAPSSYFMKTPPVQYSDSEARNKVEEFIAAYAVSSKKKPAKKRGAK